MSESSPSIQLWLDRLQAGEPDARNELIRHTYTRLKLLTRQMLREYPRLRAWEETSDVFQNVLVRLDRTLQAVKITTPRDFLRLATTQIRRELIDLTRHHFGPEGLGTNMVAPGGADWRNAPPEPVDKVPSPESLSRWEELHTQIANLEEDDRELFELLYYQGLTQNEAATLLGMSLTTFKRRWRWARVRLMTLLGGELPI
jgi:RNA polymerase sigma-70 factor (ECF subfamily)